MMPPLRGARPSLTHQASTGSRRIRVRSTTRSEASGSARRHSPRASVSAGLLVGLLVSLSALRATATQPRVLILYTAGDPNMEAGRAHVATVYNQAGFLVDQLTSMPANLGPYCCAWDIRAREDLTTS